MNRFFYCLLTLGGCIFTSCESKKDYVDSFFHPRLIDAYIEPQALNCKYSSEHNNIEVIVEGEGISKSYRTETYDSLSRAHNDLNYNVSNTNPYIAVLYASPHDISVIALSDFDSAHLAGANLSDIVQVEYTTYDSMVFAGYDKEKGRKIESGNPFFVSSQGGMFFRENMMNANYSKYELFDNRFSIHFKSYPSKPGPYKFKVIMKGINYEVSEEVGN